MSLPEPLRIVRETFRNRPIIVAILLVALVITGFVLVAIASTTEVASMEEQTIEGVVPPLVGDETAQLVPEAIYSDFGFAEARALVLQCGVGIHFLTEPEWRDYQATGNLGQPLLHCERATATLPGSVSAVLVENQRLNASSWAFELTLFEVTRPLALLGLPATVLLIVAGPALALLVLQHVILGWMER